MLCLPKDNPQTVDWQCGANPEHQFRAKELTPEEFQRTPWRWCPKCGSSSRILDKTG